MPGEVLGNGLHLGLFRCLSTTTETSGSLLLLEHSLYLLTVLRNDGLLTLEVLTGKVLTQISVGEYCVAAIGLVDGLEKEPTTDEAFLIRLGSSTGCRSEILRAVLELNPVDRNASVAFTGDHKVADTLRGESQRSGHREPLVTEVATEHGRHACRRLGLHRHFDLSDDLTIGRLLADIERSVISCFGRNDEITVSETAEVDIFVTEPAALGRKRSLVAAEGIDGIDELGRYITAGSTVAVDLNLLGSLVDTHATHRLEYFLNSSIGIESHLLNASRTALVITR